MNQVFLLRFFIPLTLSSKLMAKLLIVFDLIASSEFYKNEFSINYEVVGIPRCGIKYTASPLDLDLTVKV